MAGALPSSLPISARLRPNRTLLLIALTILCDMPATAGARTGYFPPPARTQPEIGCRSKTLESRPIVDDFKDDWYGKHLRAAREPSLYLRSKSAQNGGKAAIRFLWLRRFHPPIVVRLEWGKGETAQLIARQLSGAGGYDPGKVTRAIDRPLSVMEFLAFRRMLDDTFAFTPRVRTCDLGFDGAQWIIEASHGGAYHFVEAWSPKKGDVRKIGLAMLRLTGRQFPKDEFY